MGISPRQISPQQGQQRFFSDLLDLKVDRTYLEGELEKISKEACLGRMKPLLSALFQACVKQISSASYGDVKKVNAVETQYILVTRVLAKNLTGWEVMEILAGSVSQSDVIFAEFTEALDTIMGDNEAPASIRHQVLQLALAYMCGVAQQSTGAYFLRRDFFPSIISFVKASDMEQYTFDAILFLAILANYHKSDAARLNPYLRRIRESTDGDFMRKLCWASNFALGTSIKAYQDISNDSLAPTLVSSLGAVITHLRPDHALSFISQAVPGNKFKDMPIEASVVLLPIYEFLGPNPLFATVLLEDLVSQPAEGLQITPLPCTIISFTSYLCTHASSEATPRSIAYARIALNILLSLVENSMVLEFSSQADVPTIRLCRQRLPTLPPPPRSMQPAVNSILDCCVLWLRHNLYRRLEVHSYTKCIGICHRIVWFLQHRRLRLDYDWRELWNSVIALLNFLALKIETLHTIGGVDLLTSEAIRLLDLVLCTSEAYLPSAQALHELVYELVRSSGVLKKQEVLLKSLALSYPSSTLSSLGNSSIENTLADILKMASFYEEKVLNGGTAMGPGNVQDVLKIIAEDIEANGLHGTREVTEMMSLARSQDVLDFGHFARSDVFALLP